ncbi:NAD(P)H-dependent flavin oxidoreductase [Zavarzinia sp.]|uniref:NAD(P)H-dependent flavin oxidoreductase n=1 Tax=Zavarzinia sp. TaxID=2027920 RepID=UPI0035679BA8
MTLHTPICDLLGIEHPVLLAGMGGVAFAEVCAAVSEAGGYGCLGMAALPPERIREEMRKVRALTSKPFAVDLLTALPETLVNAVDIIIEEGASAFVAGLGVPAPIMRKLKDAGLKVMAVCGSVHHGLKAEAAGCDAVIAQGTEGGGHTGRIAGMALIPQMVDALKIPVVAAGSIVDGRGLAAALAFGAVGAWMGTRFIASNEANAAEGYKAAVLRARDEDTVITRCFTGKTLRAIKNSYTAEWEGKQDQIQPFPMQAMISAQAGANLTLMGVTDGIDADRACLAAGQGSGGIHEILPAGEIVRRTVAEAEAVIARLPGLVNRRAAAE